MKIRKVLITGSGGFIGRHLCRYLAEKGFEILDANYRLTDLNRPLADVTNFTQLVSIDKLPNALIHLAGKTSIKDSLTNPYETYYTNFLGTLNLLEFARIKKIKKFINLSTYVYGQAQYLPIDEKHPVDPHSPYNKSKLLAEQLCHFYSQDFGIDIVTLRPFYLYGPNPKPSSLLHSIIEQIKKKDGKVILSGQYTSRDFLFIGDFVDLVEKVLNQFPEGYSVYNVGSGTSNTIKEVAELIAKIMDKKLILEYQNNNNSKINYKDVSDMKADISKVSSTFNWKPSTGLEKGLELSIKNSS